MSKKIENTNSEDRTFVAGIVSSIATYAKDHDMDPDETLRSVAEWLLALLEIATFKDWQDGGSNDGT